MTVLRLDAGTRTAVNPIGDRHGRALHALLDEQPIVNAVVAARVAAAGSLRPDRLGGTVLATGTPEHLTGACFSGGNLLPIGGTPDEWRVLAEEVARYPRGCSAVVGRADAVAVMWERLEAAWGRPRAVRACQPLLVLDGPPNVAAADDVAPVLPAQVERYVPAAAAMFAEELGISPHVMPGTAAFRARIARLVAAGRAFASVDFRGQVVFKAEIAAVTRHTAQIQGVWVRPDVRGRGIGAASMAAVCAHALRLAPTVSLYVNDFNLAARRMYARLGMIEHATLATVLVS